MPSPNKKKRKIIDDSDSPSNSEWRRRITDDKSDWQKLLSGAVTPDATSTNISVTLQSPFLETPVERPAQPQRDTDGFAIPTPGLSALKSVKDTPAASTIPTPASTNLTPGLIATASSTVPPNPLSALLSTKLTPSSVIPQSTRQLTPFTPSSDELKDVPSMALNFRKLIITAYQVFEEETLLKLEDKEIKTHMNSMLDGMKQKSGARGDKLVLKLKELLDYIPKSYHDWQRSAMQKMFHRNFMQAVCLHLYR